MNIFRMIVLSIAVLSCFDGLARSISFVVHDVGAIQYPAGLDAADMDGDGDIDIVLTDNFINDSTYDLRWFRNEGNGLNWTDIPICDEHARIPLSGVIISDIDSDGHADLLTAGFVGGPSGHVSWWENVHDNATTWTRHIVSTAFRIPQISQALDVNGDRKKDIIVSDSFDSKFHLFLNQGNSLNWTDQLLSNPPPGQSADCLVAGDLDGDGKIDLAGTNGSDNYVMWWRNVNGNALTWSNHIFDTSLSDVYSLRVVDMDGDNDNDLLGGVQTFNRQTIWYENNSQTATSWTRHTIDSDVGALIPYDIDEDFDMDVVTKRTLKVLYFENVDGMAETWTSRSVAENVNSPQSICVADVDNDLDPDIIVTTHNLYGGQNRLYWYENTTLLKPLILVNATSQTTSSLHLAWQDRSNDETGFNIYVSTNTLLAEPITTATANVTQTNLTHLTPNTAYVCVVTAFSTTNESGKARPEVFWTKAQSPLPLQVLEAGDSILRLRIDPNDGNPQITQYAIKNETLGVWINAEGAPSPIPLWQTQSQWSVLTLNNLNANTAYQLKAYARNGVQVISAGQELNISTVPVLLSDYRVY